MIVNGYIQTMTRTGGGLDNQGDPIAVEETWGEPIAAMITPSGNGRLLKYQDGAQVAASYQVLLETQEFISERIRLTSDNGQDLGEHQVLRPNVRFMESVGRVKITV